jgi:arylsulfatase A-like enzyme
MPRYADHFRLERPRGQLLGGLMTAAGYQTVLIGKRHWHRDPTDTGGFENVVPIERCKRQQSLAMGGWGHPCGFGGNELSVSDSPLPRELYSTNWCVDRCCEVLSERDRTRPLFLWCSLTDPHPPLSIHEPYYSMYRHADMPKPVIGDWVNADACPFPHRRHALAWGGRHPPEGLRDAAAVYAGMITNLDHQLGRLFGMVQKLGLWDDCLVIYASDHGEMLGDHGDAGKSSFYRSASDIPMIIRPPRPWMTEPDRESAALVGLCDLLPTIAASGGATAPGDVDGCDLGPLLRGEAESVRDIFVGAIDGRYLVDDGAHRWLYHVCGGSEQLFSAGDRHEEHPLPCEDSTVGRLRAHLVHWLQQAGSDDVVDGRLRRESVPHVDESDLRATNPLGLGAHAGRFLQFSGPV